MPAPLQSFPSNQPHNAESWLQFVQDLLSNELAEDSNTKREDESWLPIICHLSDNVLLPFTSTTTPWEGIAEEVRILNSSLELIQRIHLRARTVYRSKADIAKVVLARLLHICMNLVCQPVREDTLGGLPSPQSVAIRCAASAASILKSIGGDVSPSDIEPSWKVLRATLAECLDAIDEILEAVASYPICGSIFGKTKVQHLLTRPTDRNADTFMLLNGSQRALAVCVLLEVMIQSLFPGTVASHLVPAAQRRAKGLFNRLHDHCTSAREQLSISARLQVLARMCLVSAQLPAHTARLELISGSFCKSFLRIRLQQQANANLDYSDRIFCRALKALEPKQRYETASIVVQFLRGSGTLQDVDVEAAPFSYLVHCAFTNDDVASVTGKPTLDVLLARVEDVVSKAPPARPRLTETHVEEGIEHLSTLLGTDLSSLPSSSLTPEALDAAKRSIYDQSSEELLAIVSSGSAPAFLSLLRAIRNGPAMQGGAPLMGLLRLIQSRSTPMSTDGLCCVLEALSLSLAACSSLRPKDCQEILETMCQYLEHQSRRARLLAGRSLKSCILMDAKEEKIAAFRRIEKLVSMKAHPIQETSLITLGLIARTERLDVRGLALYQLTTHLGQSDTVLSGIAYMQIVSVSKYLKKSTSQTLSPHLPEIAPFIALRLVSHPNLLEEALRLLSMPSRHFFNHTITHILPHIFMKGDKAVLDRVLEEMQNDLHEILSSYSHLVFAHIFLLPSKEHEGAMHFMDRVLSGYSESLTVARLLRTCAIALLGEIIIATGDIDAVTSSTATTALARLLKTFADDPDMKPHRKTDADRLYHYMFALFAHMYKKWQDSDVKTNTTIKGSIIRGLGTLITGVGSSCSEAAPQLTALLRTALAISEISDSAVSTWALLLNTVKPAELPGHFSLACASFLAEWPNLSFASRGAVSQFLEEQFNRMYLEIGDALDLNDVVDLGSVEELQRVNRLIQSHQDRSARSRLGHILRRCSHDNSTIAVQTLEELKSFLTTETDDFLSGILSKDIFDPILGQAISTLLALSLRDSENSEVIHTLVYECFGIIGAVDPDRCDFGVDARDTSRVIDFSDDEESKNWAASLISEVLIGLFSSTSDMTYQSYLAYSIQQLLRICDITMDILNKRNRHVASKVKQRWEAFPSHVVEKLPPLMASKYSVNLKALEPTRGPIYRAHSTYRDWIQHWVRYLAGEINIPVARSIFGVFNSVTLHRDATVARHLLPHLVLVVILSYDGESISKVQLEIKTVLEDRVDPDSTSTEDKRTLSTQAVFMVLDHLSRWVRLTRQEIAEQQAAEKAEGKKRVKRQHSAKSERLVRVESILDSLDHSLVADAALKCKVYARALMNYERHLRTLKENSSKVDCSTYYDRLHEIYARLDEPDGMEGISTLILAPSLEHQIRQHESTGDWTAALTCWEMKLQSSSEDLSLHLGLVDCLQNLGHHETLLDHIDSVTTRHPEWLPELAGAQLQSSWSVGKWVKVEKIASNVESGIPAVAVANVLLSARKQDPAGLSNALRKARSILGAPLSAAGKAGYRQAYAAVLDLHRMRDLEMIGTTLMELSNEKLAGEQSVKLVAALSEVLSNRLMLTLPNFRVRESVVSLRRTAFSLLQHPALETAVGKTWLTSAKIARKANQPQVAYSAVLHAHRFAPPEAFIQSAKLLQNIHPLRALQDLNNAMRCQDAKEKGLSTRDLDTDTIEIVDVPSDNQLKAKIQVLRARWMNTQGRFDSTEVMEAFKKAHSLNTEWENAPYYIGKFQDERYKELPTASDRRSSRGFKFNGNTVKYFGKAVKNGSKYVYQAIPRMLTIWLDAGEDPAFVQHQQWDLLMDSIKGSIESIPGFKWYTAFPQIMSRVGHSNNKVWEQLSNLICSIIRASPQQGLWLFTSVIKSNKRDRQQRGASIVQKLKADPKRVSPELSYLIPEWTDLTTELLRLCDFPAPPPDRHKKMTLSFTRDLPRFTRLATCPMILPIQESMTVVLPASAIPDSHFQPFPANPPTFREFVDQVDVLPTLARPKKFNVIATDGHSYRFLCKPSDDLRKDARLMDLHTLINQIFKGNAEARRRQLHVRTYAIVPLNEECGMVQWVPNTVPIRELILNLYESRKGLEYYLPGMHQTYDRIKNRSRDSEAGELFVKEILPLYPPIFHEWFLEAFPEPSTWLANRLVYTRTSAVTSIVGFILGLGDRHLENILMDVNSGDAIHIDFNCLFERGKLLAVPEKVPFRLTQNMTAAFGVTGCEGPFRIACEISVRLFRANKESLMSVLDAFLHDPLVEWETDRRKLEREKQTGRGGRAFPQGNQMKPDTNLRDLAKKSLASINNKIGGFYEGFEFENERPVARAMSVENLVQLLISEATDSTNLGAMYGGWGAWF